MVAVRKAPAPAASRTNSSQPIPRIAKGKEPQTASSTLHSSADGESRAGLSHGSSASESNQNNPASVKLKGRQKFKKNGKRKKGKSSGFLQFLTQVLLFVFTVYTLSVCPNDEALEKPICRGLSAYRRLILEPYIFPPIQAALSHPSIAPHVERVTPYVNRAIEIATPVVLRTQAEWNGRVVPQWNKRVVPQWNRRVVPEWNKYAVPQIRRLEEQIQPYRVRLEQEYTHKLAPYVQLASRNIQNWQRQAQPYVVLATHKSYDGYQVAKPYAHVAWRKIKVVVKQFLLIAQEQRRRFVDPHVARLWEKTKELSSGKPKANAALEVLFHPIPPKPSGIVLETPSATPERLEDIPASSISSFEPHVTVPPQADEPAQSAASIAIESLLGATVDAIETASSSSPSSSSPSSSSPSSSSPSSSSPSSSSPSSSSPSSSSPSSSSTSTSSSVDEVLALASEVVPATTETTSPTVFIEELTPSPTPSAHGTDATETIESAASVVLASVHETATAVKSLISSFAQASLSSTAAPSSTPQPEADGDDLDLDAFYADLGLDETDSVSLEAPAPTAVPELTDKEKAEELERRKIATAEKRASIAERHAKWEKELDEEVKVQHKALRKKLVASRKTAVTELAKNTEIKAQIEGLVTEAEKYLKGAQVYLKNLQKENRKDTEKASLWERVVSKVESKFSERLRDVEAAVNHWYGAIVERELQEVQEAAAIVKDIAERAQADIGLDYAWLDDVTYEDWQRYHDLIRTSENFTEQAIAIQDGSHSSPPINPVLPALSDLQSELQDVVVGFETRLRRIKRGGERAFVPGPVDDDAIADETIPGDTQASILPVPEDGADEATLADIPPVFVGRSQEEVLAAFERAEERTQGAGESQPAAQVVEGLVQEAEAEAQFASEHMEL